ncbi:hypothetical protein BCR33DRAFT_723103 [Rhizoclosmatium globosum]|uniref:CBM2 domain-containing protein n=1 Tax=Rhizoclosmatium globosum TaxID=329046 RepID=A0A1Y2BGF6_9FUNG|nr:hypothetical protein BCR33DRAFT_723103 [Rhizoclosmatium globosum]|eukprot:ORY33892.1 hypothetical protein BCR33DRAFT_723103 [Rhizoclosmatium globosum]
MNISIFLLLIPYLQDATAFPVSMRAKMVRRKEHIVKVHKPYPHQRVPTTTTIEPIVTTTVPVTSTDQGTTCIPSVTEVEGTSTKPRFRPRTSGNKGWAPVGTTEPIWTDTEPVPTPTTSSFGTENVVSSTTSSSVDTSSATDFGPTPTTNSWGTEAATTTTSLFVQPSNSATESDGTTSVAVTALNTTSVVETATETTVKPRKYVIPVGPTKTRPKYQPRTSPGNPGWAPVETTTVSTETEVVTEPTTTVEPKKYEVPTVPPFSNEPSSTEIVPQPPTSVVPSVTEPSPIPPPFEPTTTDYTPQPPIIPAPSVTEPISVPPPPQPSTDVIPSPTTDTITPPPFVIPSPTEPSPVPPPPQNPCPPTHGSSCQLQSDPLLTTFYGASVTLSTPGIVTLVNTPDFGLTATLSSHWSNNRVADVVVVDTVEYRCGSDVRTLDGTIGMEVLQCWSGECASVTCKAVLMGSWDPVSHVQVQQVVYGGVLGIGGACFGGDTC